MVSTKELRGSKEQIVAQIQGTSGRIVSAFLVVDEPAATVVPQDDAEFAALMAQLESLAVEAGKVDYSREAMYTRMPGE